MNKRLLAASIATTILFASVATSCGKSDDTAQPGETTIAIETTVAPVETVVETEPTGVDISGFSWIVEGEEVNQVDIAVTNVTDLVISFSDDFEVPENFRYEIERDEKVIKGDGTTYARRKISAVLHYGLELNTLGFVPAGSYIIRFYDGDYCIAAFGATVYYNEDAIVSSAFEFTPGNDCTTIQLYTDDDFATVLEEPKAGIQGFYITCFTTTVHPEYTMKGTLTHNRKVINSKTTVSTDSPLARIAFENEDGSPFEAGLYRLDLYGYDGSLFATVKLYLE